jgi:hypothetical protein
MSSLSNATITALTHPSTFFAKSISTSVFVATDVVLTYARIGPPGFLIVISRSLEAIPGLISQGTKTILPSARARGIEILTI